MSTELVLKNLLSIRQAVDVVFHGIWSTGPVHSLLQEGLFRPHTYVGRDQAGRYKKCLLDFADIVALCCFHSLLVCGVRVEHLRYIGYSWMVLSRDRLKRWESADPNRRMQAFLALCDFDVIFCAEAYHVDQSESGPGMLASAPLPMAWKLGWTILATPAPSPAVDEQLKNVRDPARGNLAVLFVNSQHWYYFAKRRLENAGMVID